MSDGRIRVLVVYGTRPEAIKVAPVVRALRARSDRFAPIVCTTAQHRDMVDQVEALLQLTPDIDLDLMLPNQHLNELGARVITAIDGVLDRVRPDWLLVQGDTTTAMVSALAAFHRRVRVGHIEAGLRTGDLDRPFPEEANRRIVDTFAAALFAPTARAATVLRDEGVPATRVYLTGNTVVDALESVAARIGQHSRTGEVLITAHRRESFGPPLRAMFGAVADLAERFPDIQWVFPVHPNPSVRNPAHEALDAFPNIELHEPFDYQELIRRLMRARLVLTDSGGIQEEAPAFGTPVLVMRERTERPEGVEAGVARLVGVDRDAIVAAATEVLNDPAAERAMAGGGNPYGDGRAAERITSILAGEPWEPFRAPARFSTECV